jgi:hypothetical protein
MKRIFILLIAIVFPCALSVSWYAFGLFRMSASVMKAAEIPESVALEGGPNARQGANQCGPYAAAMALGNTDAADMVEALPWTLPGGYTHPRALEKLIARMSAHAIAYDAGSLSDDEKAVFLREKLAAGSPVILLTRMYGYQHYVTLLGYDDSGFFVYDPVFTRGDEGRTIDENGNAPGNRTMASADLLADWSGGGIAGAYTWYALVVVR